MAQAIEQRGRQLLVAEDLDPLAEGEVGGDERGALLVAIGEEIEEELAAGAVEGHEAQFVDYEKGDALVALVEASQCALIACLEQAADQVGGADESDTIATPGSFHREGDGHVRFARADR